MVFRRCTETFPNALQPRQPLALCPLIARLFYGSGLGRRPPRVTDRPAFQFFFKGIPAKARSRRGPPPPPQMNKTLQFGPPLFVFFFPRSKKKKCPPPKMYF